jgi:hypothetical protein
MKDGKEPPHMTFEQKSDDIEYPLFDRYKLCPRSVFVGGTSRHLCHCDIPTQCPGVLAVAKDSHETES